MAPIGSPSSLPSESHDYTEGASILDIDSALANSRRLRRDSQFSTLYGDDDEGTTFAGPAQFANPSSVSRMPFIESRRTSSDSWSRTRRKSRDSMTERHTSRRSSMDSQVSRQSVEGEHEEDAHEEHALIDDRLSGRSRRISISPTRKAGVFGNLSHLFGRTGTADTTHERRLSISQQSYASTSQHLRRSRSDVGSDHALVSDEEDVERWGYSSGEEESDGDSVQSMAIADNVSVSASMEYDSAPPSPSNASYGIPLMTSDPIFGGEARLDMETPFTLPDKPPPGPPSRQIIYLSDDDTTIQFVGYESVPWRLWIWRVGCLLTFGGLALLGRWFPGLWLRWVAREKAFLESRDGFVVIQVGTTFGIQ
jgi:cation-transporting P-type ATPase 13A2